MRFLLLYFHGAMQATKGERVEAMKRRDLFGLCVLFVLCGAGVLWAEKPAPNPTGDQTKTPTKAKAPRQGETKGINKQFLDAKLNVKSWQKRFERHGREVWEHRYAIIGRLGLRAGMGVADVGAGSGGFLRALWEAIQPKGQLYAVDISPRFVEHLRKRIEKEGLKGASAVLGTPRSVGLAAGSVDLIFTSDTYHHFEEVEPLLGSMHKALREGGRFVVVDFERIPGVSRPWILDHVKHDKAHVKAEVQRFGFVLEREVKLPELKENYVLIFRRVSRQGSPPSKRR